MFASAHYLVCYCILEIQIEKWIIELINCDAFESWVLSQLFEIEIKIIWLKNMIHDFIGMIGFIPTSLRKLAIKSRFFFNSAGKKLK